jgi:RP/EB family microtubule-associated protein
MNVKNDWAKEKAVLSKEYETIIQDLNQTTAELKVSLEQVEREREFYFSKLREIEILVNARLEEEGSEKVKETFKGILDIMYKTEEGFETPETETF